MRILDLPGPQFLGVFIPILAVAWILGSIARSRIKPAVGASTAEPELTSIEVAYLAGGPRLALAALVTSLAQRKAISFEARTRSVTVVAESVASENYYGRRLCSRMGKDERTLESLEDDAGQVFAEVVSEYAHGVAVDSQHPRLPFRSFSHFAGEGRADECSAFERIEDDALQSGSLAETGAADDVHTCLL